MKPIIALYISLLLSACSGDQPATDQSTSTAATAPSSGQPAQESADTQADSPVTYSVTDVDAAGAVKLIATQPDLVILDIRTPEEFAAGHIDGAVNIDFRSPDFGAKLDELDKSKPYLMHCRSGGRSTSALPQFESKSFGAIYHFNTGYASWESN